MEEPLRDQSAERRRLLEADALSGEEEAFLRGYEQDAMTTMEEPV